MAATDESGLLPMSEFDADDGSTHIADAVKNARCTSTPMRVGAVAVVGLAAVLAVWCTLSSGSPMKTRTAATTVLDENAWLWMKVALPHGKKCNHFDDIKDGLGGEKYADMLKYKVGGKLPCVKKLDNPCSGGGFLMCYKDVADLEAAKNDLGDKFFSNTVSHKEDDAWGYWDSPPRVGTGLPMSINTGIGGTPSDCGGCP